MEQNIIYHGSNVEVAKPRILQNGFYKDFVAACRKGIEHDYDIVEGPMADDQIWNYVEGFISEKVPRNVFWELVKFAYPTHQIVFCTEEALKTLTFEGSDTL